VEKDNNKRNLGKGLDALFGDNILPFENEAQMQKDDDISIDLIDPNQDQPRTSFDQAALQELAASIKEYGIVQPIVLRHKGDRYQIIVGERRWRAAKIAGLLKVPAVIRVAEDDAVLHLAIIENIQREDLNPIEEAIAYQKLMTQHGYTQEALAEKLGKSRPAIANTIRLLQLPRPIREAIEKKLISMGHARALLAIADKEAQISAFQKVIKKGLSVREVEALVKRLDDENRNERRSALKETDRTGKIRSSVFLKDMEAKMRESLGTGVRIFQQDKKGKIEVDFYSDEDLTRLYEIISKDRML